MFGELGKDQKGWGLTTLGECCELNPKRPRNIDDELKVSFVPMPAISEDGKIDCSNIKTYKEVRKGFTYFAENDVIFAKITPCMENGKGAVAKGLSGGIGSGSTEFHVLRPIEGKSNPYWLYIITLFKSFRVGARKVMTGTGGQLRVPVGYLRDFPISLPPISLQDSFEGFVHQSDKSKFACLKSQFIEMFGEPITNPNNIVKKKLGELASLITKGASPTWQGVSYTDDTSQTLFVTSENVREGWIDLSERKYLEDGFNEKQKRSMLKKGDFLINIVGASIGRAARYDLDDKANINQAVALVRVSPEVINPDYLLVYLNSEKAIEMYNGMKSSVARANLSLQNISDLEILLPSQEGQNQYAQLIRQSDKSK